MTLALKEQILLEALELPDEAFLVIARKIFEHKQRDLIPITVRLLENMNTPGAIHLLQSKTRGCQASCGLLPFDARRAFLP